MNTFNNYKEKSCKNYDVIVSLCEVWCYQPCTATIQYLCVLLLFGIAKSLYYYSSRVGCYLYYSSRVGHYLGYS